MYGGVLQKLPTAINNIYIYIISSEKLHTKNGETGTEGKIIWHCEILEGMSERMGKG